ncbi:hypothetical protein H0H93_002918, partial [Arthromyces matolae]
SNGSSNSRSHHKHEKATLRNMERKYSDKVERPTDVEEVWFAGCHCDVGGGSVANGTPHTLARIPLRWMIRECFKAETGIMFKSEALKTIGLDPATLYPYVQKRPAALPATGVHIRRIRSPAEKNAENAATAPAPAPPAPAPTGTNGSTPAKAH